MAYYPSSTPTQPPQGAVLQVSELNAEARHLLEKQLGTVWITGELTNLAQPHSGHWYFTLKDAAAQVRCAMFRGRNLGVRFRPQNGQQVLIQGRVSLYEPRGDYQLIADAMLPSGDGLLQLQFEQLKTKLQAQGLFDSERKQAIPGVATLGVITSPQGAAIADVLQILNRRAPQIDIVIYPSLVQGATAPEQLIQAIEVACQRQEVDALLLTRGGGSLEDLSCFNDEALAHAIAACPLPIVSAVGHEIDVTIADLVADLRAPTPSAGAELLSEARVNLEQKMQHSKQRLMAAWSYYLLRLNNRLGQLEARLAQHHPERRIEHWQQNFDRLQLRLEHALYKQWHQHEQKLEKLSSRLWQRNPNHLLPLIEQKQAHLSNRLAQSMLALLDQKNQHLGQRASALNQLSPLNILARGYSITSTEQGCLRSIAEVKPEQVLQTRLKDGEITSTVLAIKADRLSG